MRVGAKVSASRASKSAAPQFRAKRSSHTDSLTATAASMIIKVALEFALNRPSGEDNSYGDSPEKGDFDSSHGFLSLKSPCYQ